MKWFRHDSNANADAKIQKVLMKYGVKGYGLYFYCLELIAAGVDGSNINFELEHDAEILAFQLKMTESEVQEIMQYMIGLNLFDIQTGRIRCLKLAKRLDDTMTRNPHMKKMLNSLEEQGLIEGKPGKSKAPEIFEDLPELSEDLPEISEDIRGTSARLDQIRLDKEILKAKAHTLPGESDKIDTSNMWKAKNGYIEKYEIVCPVDINPEALDKWIRYKNERGEMYKSMVSVKSFCTMLLKSVSMFDNKVKFYAQMEIVNRSIMKRWSGIHGLNQGEINAIKRQTNSSGSNGGAFNGGSNSQQWGDTKPGYEIALERAQQELERRRNNSQ